MQYKGYEIIEENNAVYIEQVKDFNPVHIFESGQCFRWIRQKDGSYTGVALNKVVNIKYENGTLLLLNSNVQDFKELWFDYLDLGTDYSEMKMRLDRDEVMHRAIEFGAGIRLLKQDLWETVISFLISSNNHIPRIMKIISSIAENFGEKLTFGGNDYYTFPGADRLSNSSIEQMAVCRSGYRCKYIMETSRMIAAKQVNLESLNCMTTAQAREGLMKLPGVGPKVADCVLLFSGTKRDVFPTDVWVKRVMEELYFKREASIKEIQEFVKDYFGELAGIAQQYLFFYARENRIGV